MIYAEVIGDPIAHSKSPLIHNFWLAKLGIAADYRKTHVRPEELASFLAERRRDPDWRGCNVTVPHKEGVIAHLDRLDPLAERIGAVNTVVIEGGELIGYNSDALGFMEPLVSILADECRMCASLVLGAGGAARAIITALDDAGCGVIVAARDMVKAKAIVADRPLVFQQITALAFFAHPVDPPEERSSKWFNLFVNTTSLGMTGKPPLAFDFSHAPEDSIIYDIVYAPLETPFLAEARARGLRTIDGLHMLIGQAAIAFAKFFRQPAPREHDAELRALLTA